MRLRHIPGAEEAVAESPYVIKEPQRFRGQFKNIFGNDNPIEIEIGMGKGKFVTQMAEKYPEINFIGAERYPSVLLYAIRKREQKELPNLFFLCLDAKKLADIFAPEEIAKIYLNFSDPWPKDRHAKRRLTSPDFIKVYDWILKKDGVIEFKTDNRELFDYSLNSIPQAGWKIDAFTKDLHHSDMAADNVMTEYEIKFSALGNPICKLIASR